MYSQLKNTLKKLKKGHKNIKHENTAYHCIWDIEKIKKRA